MSWQHQSLEALVENRNRSISHSAFTLKSVPNAQVSTQERARKTPTWLTLTNWKLLQYPIFHTTWALPSSLKMSKLSHKTPATAISAKSSPSAFSSSKKNASCTKWACKSVKCAPIAPKWPLDTDHGHCFPPMCEWTKVSPKWDVPTPHIKQLVENKMDYSEQKTTLIEKCMWHETKDYWIIDCYRCLLLFWAYIIIWMLIIELLYYFKL